MNPRHCLNSVTCHCLLHLGVVNYFRKWDYFRKFRAKREFVSSPKGIWCASFRQRNDRFLKKMLPLLTETMLHACFWLGWRLDEVAVTLLSHILYFFTLEVNYWSVYKNRGEKSISYNLWVPAAVLDHTAMKLYTIAKIWHLQKSITRSPQLTKKFTAFSR